MPAWAKTSKGTGPPQYQYCYLPVRIRIFCPKTTNFGPKLAFLVIGISQDTYLLFGLNGYSSQSHLIYPWLDEIKPTGICPWLSVASSKHLMFLCPLPTSDPHTRRRSCTFQKVPARHRVRSFLLQHFFPFTKENPISFFWGLFAVFPVHQLHKCWNPLLSEQHLSGNFLLPTTFGLRDN